MTKKMTWIATVAIAALTIASGANAVFGAATMWTIDPLGTDTVTEGRAITSNGIVAGISGAQGIAWRPTTPVAGTTTLMNSSDGASSQASSGIGYRTVNGQSQLVAEGLTSSGYNWYSSLDDGATWGPKNRPTNLYSPYSLPTANSLAATPSSDTYYGVFSDTGNLNSLGNTMYIMKLSGGSSPNYVAARTGPEKGQVGVASAKGNLTGVSYTGLAVGRARTVSGSSVYRNYTLQYTGTGTPTAGTFNGLDGTNAGEAWAISGDGTQIFGWSPTAALPGSLLPYKYTVGGAITALPLLPGTTGSTSLGLAYGASEHGDYAVGYDYVGVTRAAIWSKLNDPNSANWQVQDLTTLASTLGVLGPFSVLTKAYSVAVATDGSLWITGIGSLASGGATRGFVMNIPVPEPATLGFLAIGGLAFIRRRR